MQEMQEMQVWSLGQEDPLEKEMATHSRVLSWRIPGMGEPGGLMSMGSHRVRHDWRDLAAAAAYRWYLKLGYRWEKYLDKRREKVQGWVQEQKKVWRRRSWGHANDIEKQGVFNCVQSFHVCSIVCHPRVSSLFYLEPVCIVICETFITC